MTIKPQQIKDMRIDMLEALKPVAEKYGLALDKTNAKYSETTVTFSLGFTEVELDANGVNLLSEWAIAYNSFHKSYDLPAGILSKTFTNGGKTFVFAGVAISRSKYPFVGLNKKTKEVIFFTDGPTIRKQLVGI